MGTDFFKFKINQNKSLWNRYSDCLSMLVLDFISPSYKYKFKLGKS